MQRLRPAPQALLLALLDSDIAQSRRQLHKLSTLPARLFAQHLELLCHAGAVQCSANRCRLSVPLHFMVRRSDLTN
jgi:hypothetical protein